MAHFREPFCLESGKIENHLLPCDTPLKELAFAICLHGKAAITLQDINVSPPYKCSFLVSGCLFSKVEASLPKQNSVWIMGLAFLHRSVCDTCTVQLHFVTVLFDCSVALELPCLLIPWEMLCNVPE